MLHDHVEPKRCSKLTQNRAAPETWLLVASIAWCAVLGCGLVYLILIAAL